MSLDWLAGELAEWDAAGLRRQRRAVMPLEDGAIEVDGRRLINLAGNDYLGLAGDPRLKQATKQAIDESGCGARASALVCGRTIWHERLEERLARFKGAEAAVVFPTGYAANAGTIATLIGSGDAVFCDRLNHASLIDGSRNSGARFRVFPHLDLQTLERELKKSAGSRRRLIVTDSVFSMDGDVAPLVELSELSLRYDAMLLIDEAHATGVLGTLGRGLAEHDGIDKRNLISVGTLSKAVGAMGGFVTGSRALCDWLWNTARPQVFSTSLFTPAAAAACAALDVIAAEPWRRARLMELASRLRESLVSLGCRIPPTRIVTPIIPIILGEEARTVDAARRLEAAGFLVAAIRPPTVPRGQSRLRLSLHALLKDEQLGSLVSSLEDTVRK